MGGRGAGERARPDLLTIRMAARDEESGESMSDAQLRNEVMTMMIAGHETTANAVSWLWVLLDRHPDEQERLRAELVCDDRRPVAAVGRSRGVSAGAGGSGLTGRITDAAGGRPTGSI